MSHDLAHPLPTHCASCGAALQGPFCHHCGEERPDPHHLTLAHFTHDLVHEFTHLDGKIFGTIRHLFERPGALTVAFLEGRKNQFIRPLRLYLFIVALQLIVLTTASYSGILTSQTLERYDTTGVIHRRLERFAEKHHLEREVAHDEINHVIAKTYSIFKYLVPLALGLLLTLLYRKQQPFYVANLIFAIHFCCFRYVLSMPMSWLVQKSQFFVPLGLLLNLVYLYFAVVRVYHLSRTRAAFHAILLSIWTTLLEFLVILAAFAVALIWSIQS